ncbi:DUF4256 domain-containing protein [Sharpea azabuensis]|uniref:DUF4256 domain-containing protein n=1 Tax=Sharpea porci TaxID=2652286 RepID=A0A844FWD1_9FIRM|nr:DUF4256 domain-containing protein [Sharpea porci]MST89866.1 DUF4256 domain-containing protein [Sharpea porci]
MDLLKQRFEEHMNRHPNLTWEDVEQRLTAQIRKVIANMEATGGEPDVVVFKDKIAYVDCCKESPKERRSLCFDEEARRKRKKNPPKSSVQEEAESIGIQLLSIQDYQDLQSLEEFDLKTSSWVATPDSIREKGGVVFMEKRYGTVFLYHNGADSYYASRGFRGYIEI